MNIKKQIATELQLEESQIKTVADLFAEDATVPFISRYRKEKTGGLDEEQLRDIEDKLNYYQLLEDRKESILKSIEEQGKLTDELKTKWKVFLTEASEKLENLYEEKKEEIEKLKKVAPKKAKKIKEDLKVVAKIAVDEVKKKVK